MNTKSLYSMPCSIFVEMGIVAIRLWEVEIRKNGKWRNDFQESEQEPVLFFIK